MLQIEMEMGTSASASATCNSVYGATRRLAKPVVRVQIR